MINIQQILKNLWQKFSVGFTQKDIIKKLSNNNNQEYMNGDKNKNSIPIINKNHFLHKLELMKRNMNTKIWEFKEEKNVKHKVIYILSVNCLKLHVKHLQYH